MILAQMSVEAKLIVMAQMRDDLSKANDDVT